MSFFSKLWTAVKSLWKKAPSIGVAVASAINYIVPFIEGLDEIITPELAPELNPILDKIKVGITALKVTVSDIGPNPNFTAIVTSINTNLTALIAAAQVKDAATAEKIQAVATLVTGELAAITAANG